MAAKPFLIKNHHIIYCLNNGRLEHSQVPLGLQLHEEELGWRVESGKHVVDLKKLLVGRVGYSRFPTQTCE